MKGKGNKKYTHERDNGRVYVPSMHVLQRWNGIRSHPAHVAGGRKAKKENAKVVRICQRREGVRSHPALAGKGRPKNKNSKLTRISHRAL